MTSFMNIQQFRARHSHSSSRTQFPKAFHKLPQKLSSHNIFIHGLSHARMLLSKLAKAVKVSTIVDGEQMFKVTIFKQGIVGR